jgi:endoglucanase
MRAALALIAAAFLSVAAAPPAQIRLNQLGLLADGPKRAMFANASNAPMPWQLIDSSGRVQASGTTEPFGNDSESGEHVHRVDFSGFRGTGTGYHLVAAGQTSRSFSITDNVYSRLPYDALEYFYHSRAGTPIEARFVGEQWARPAGHAPERATCISGRDSNGNLWPGCPYTLEVTGGWYDAGDQGKYLVNGGIALWTLLDLYERNHLQGADSEFADGAMRIPEAGNGISDLLDEARWEMEFFLKMQVPQGTRLRLPVGAKRNTPGLSFTEIDASGMAHHKVADEHWTPLPTRPDRDPLVRYLFPPSTGATLNLAATAAQCARIWRTIDPAFAARCLTAAERAWAAAQRNPQVYAIDSFTGSGGYGDADLSDEFYWAASELLATTGKAEYRNAVEASPWFRDPLAKEANWSALASLGTITLALSANALSDRETQRLRSAIAAAADRFLADEKLTGYAVPLAGDYTWGSNSVLLNRAIVLALAHDFTGAPRYRDGVIDVADYLLGRNPLDRSFVTGYGARPMENPHHRFWAHSLDPAYPPPPPGVLSGGPNNIAMADEVARPMKGTCAPQTCWVDNAHAFSLNEVAINWNAPLVWVSAWLANSEAQKK